MSSTSSRRSRNDSPAPKAKAQLTKIKSAEELKKEQEKKEEERKKAEEEAKMIWGLHPEAFWVLVLGPLVVVVTICSAVFLKDFGFAALDFVKKKWDLVSDPIEKLLASRADLVVMLAMAAVLTPLLLVGVVTLFRAIDDVMNFPAWQKASVLSIVFVAFMLYLREEERYWKLYTGVQNYWAKFSDPVEAFLKTRSDELVAGAAIMCLAPIGVALIKYVLNAVWGCRVVIAVEPTDSAKSPGTKA